MWGIWICVISYKEWFTLEYLCVYCKRLNTKKTNQKSSWKSQKSVQDENFRTKLDIFEFILNKTLFIIIVPKKKMTHCYLFLESIDQSANLLKRLSVSAGLIIFCSIVLCCLSFFLEPHSAGPNKFPQNVFKTNQWKCLSYSAVLLIIFYWFF